MRLVKYPRTHHIEGSRFQIGDEELDFIPFSQLRDRNLVVEEKMDGANSAISFDASGKMYLQSRGHYLTGGGREKHFDYFKQWAYSYQDVLFSCLGSRYIAFGEWLYAKHTIFYNDLPHYWLEFDVYDRDKHEFLSTERRRELLANTPVVPVSVLHNGRLSCLKDLESMLGPSLFIAGNHFDDLLSLCESLCLSRETCMKETDPSRLMEGLYIKVEEEGIVKERYKFIRTSFLQTVASSESHWLNRPIVPNQLHVGVDILRTS